VISDFQERGVTNILASSVADPHHFYADPDPTFNSDADPDPTFQFDADPYLDPTHSLFSRF